ncbi:Long-chain-fatty-acid--CoA ligase ACSBG2 [Acipenser ruthenus]|uniref:Long-chain-fatty-acid--CoA ligase ACSBG2 n=1 Tax=Acipenser ruthenus TaxID=7906 RepID=A0A444UXP9_ACIRT|nr:Long-chain-fatty-acid--CoA ligase ACSBG2 [Acipenser ruthenus]
MTPALQSGSSVSTQESKPVTANADVLRPDTLNLNELKLCTTKEDGEVKLRMGDSGQAAEPAITVNQMFLQTVEQYGDQVALASKDGDNWNRLTYKEYYQRCRTAAKSFLKLGLERYHGVGILGFNSPEWFIADIGAILAGGFAVGIYTTNSPEACQYVAENCKANVLVVENHKQLQKILQIQDKLPHVKAIIQYKDALKEKKPNLYTWAEFMEMGTDVPDSQLDEIIASQKPNQCCTLIYTSGTTGQPKGVMLSHDNITWTASATGKTVKLKHACEAQEVVVSYLPLSHIAAQMIDIWLPIKYGGVIYFAQPDALKCNVNPDSGEPEDELTPEAIEFCQKLGSKALKVSDIVGGKDRAVHKAIQEGIDRVNEQASSNAQKIQKWTILEKDFSLPGGELGKDCS